MMKKKFYILLAMLLVSVSVCGCSVIEIQDETEKEETTNEIYNSDIYEFIDKETGVHYWIYSHGAGYQGMGGMTPRLNHDGSVMIDEIENDK